MARISELDSGRSILVAVATGVLVGAALGATRVIAYDWLGPVGGVFLLVAFAIPVATGTFCVVRKLLVLPGVTLVAFLAMAAVPADDAGLGNPVVGDVVVAQLLVVVLVAAAVVELGGRRLFAVVRDRRSDRAQ